MAVPQDNAIIAQASAGEVQENLSGYFHGLLSKFQELQISLPSMSTIQKIKQAFKQIGEIVTGSEESTKLIILRKRFNDVMQFGDNFIDSCQTMAEYASKTEYVQIIIKELQDKKLDELKRYVTALSDFLYDCKTTFELYQGNEDDLNKYLSQTELYFKTNLMKVKNQIDIVKVNFQNADNSAMIPQKSGETATLAGAGVVGAKPTSSAKAAIATGFYLVCVCEAAVKASDREEELKRLMIKQKKLEDGHESIAELHCSIQEAMKFIKDMERYTQLASHYIKNSHQSSKHQESVGVINFYEVEIKLKAICQVAGKMIEQINDHDKNQKYLKQ